MQKYEKRYFAFLLIYDQFDYETDYKLSFPTNIKREFPVNSQEGGL